MEWINEFIEEYDPIHDANEYLNVDDALQWHVIYQGTTLLDAAKYMESEEVKEGLFTTYLEDLRPQVSWVYNKLRKHFEEVEEFEKCERCVQLEKQIRYEFLQLQIRNEKKEIKRNPRSMGI